MKLRFPRFAALVLVLPLFAGCLVIERKTLVLVLPPDSRELHLYYLFEGISVLEHSESNLATAEKQLKNLGNDDLSFFVNGSLEVAGPRRDDPILKLFRFEPIRFYRDPTRKRQLCA